MVNEYRRGTGATVNPYPGGGVELDALRGDALIHDGDAPEAWTDAPKRRPIVISEVVRVYRVSADTPALSVETAARAALEAATGAQFFDAD